MNVLSRRMFKKNRPRPARDALNRAGGIMSSSPELMNTVQRFQPGGVVEPGENVRIPGIPVSGADVKKFLDYIDFDNFIDYLGIRKPKPRSPAGYILGEDPGQRLETISEKVSEYPFIPGIKKALPYVGIATVATPVNKTEAEMQAVDDGKTVQQQMMEQRYPEIDLNEISISANPAFTTNEGADLQAEIEAQKIASEMQKEAEKRKQMEEASATGLPVEDIDFRAKKRDEGANILTGVEEDADKASEAAKIAKELSLYGEGKLREKEVLEKEEKRQDILAEETRMQQGQISASGENIAKSVETGNQDALSSQLKDLMAQFTSNAPKYEGLDKGMALMKIGFAMAAGRSPYAMQNIANALSGGADMFIADKAKKDQFNRQVQLSALQYGLGEIGKEKAQQRADERNFTTYVVGKGGITLPDGRKVEEGQDITLSMQDALKLGPQLSNLSLLDAFTKRQASMTKLLAAELKVLEAKKDKGIDLKEFRKDATEYKESIKAAKDAEVAKALIGDALLTVSEKDLTSLSATGKELIRKGATLFGIPVSKEFKTKPLFKRQLNIALNKIIPLALGKTQSANSISDRDVGFIIKAFLAEGIINQNEETGVITIDSSFLGADEDSIAKGLQSALQLIEDEQRDDFRKMSSIERNFGDVMIKGPDVTGSKFLELEIAERKGLTGGTERKYVLEDGVYRRRTN